MVLLLYVGGAVIEGKPAADITAYVICLLSTELVPPQVCKLLVGQRTIGEPVVGKPLLQCFGVA
tara:strand:- start:165 stop:356 length:192 start_codon:yes stop_codon:yes gene_type:complete